MTDHEEDGPEGRAIGMGMVLSLYGLGAMIVGYVLGVLHAGGFS
jgi:hypothetical protein